METLNTYVLNDRNARIMKQVAYYVANTIGDKNDIQNMSYINNRKVDGEVDGEVDNSNKRRKFDNVILGVSKHYNKDQRKNGRRIHYTLVRDIRYYIEYDNCDFWFTLKERGDNPVEYQGIQFYQEIFIETNASRDIMDKFYNDTDAYFNKYYLDFEDADGKIKVMVNNEGYWENLNIRPRRSLDTIYLPMKDVNAIQGDIDKFLKDSTRKRFHHLGIPYKRNYLFEGRWGTGKTSFIVALASKFNFNISIISFHDKFTDLDLMHALRSVPDKSFLVLEDIDAMFQERKKNDEVRNRISFSTLLNVLDGLAHKDGLITFMTTNYKVHLDPALIRPGRIDYVMHFDYAKKEEIRRMFNHYFDLEKCNKEKFGLFWENYRKNVNVRSTTSLLQQYFFKYLDDIDGAIKNVSDIEDMSNACNQEVKKGLYT